MSGPKIWPELFLRAPFYEAADFDVAGLPRVLQDTRFRNAVWLASPALWERLEAKGFDAAGLTEGERTTLLNYFNRMCFRPTPFGSFATFGLTAWDAPRGEDPEAYLTLLPDRACSRNAFGPPAPILPATPLRKNPTLYQVGKYLRSIYMSVGPQRKYEFKIAQDEAERLNLALLRFLGEGVRPAGEVAALLVEKAACDLAEAYEYLRFLVEDQFLYTPAQGHIIGHHDAERAAHWSDWCRQPLSGVGELSRALAGRLPLADGGPRSAFCYAGLERGPQEAAPGLSDRSALLGALEFLQSCAVPVVPEALQHFISRFQARFDLEEVPLLLALDPDTGIAYEDRNGDAIEDEVLADLVFPSAPGSARPVVSEELRALLLARWLSANGGELRFTAADLALLPAGGVAAPSTAVMFRHTVAGLQLEHVAGISATQLIGRFSLFSPEIHDLCRRLAAAEAAAAPQALFADIGQQSHSHVDNINRRRPIYPYEIPVNVFSQAEESQLLTLSDLRLSVRNGELLLRSVRLGRQVLPRLATAYQYRHNELPLFRFLGDLQLQGMAPVPGLDLARIFPDLDHYPRVCFEGTILSAARWSVSEAELRAAVATPGAMRSFQERKRLPALISLGQQDRQLVVDLEKPEQWSWLLANIKGQGKVVLQEYLAPGTRFAGQYIAFLNATAGTAPATCPALSPRPKATRRFLPGQEWLYLKYYCTPATADRLLHEVIGPVIRSHRRRWSCWFFIRYQDPDHHLRLRVRALSGDPSALLSAFAVRLRKSGLGPLISKVSYDTYERELERYGAGFIYPVEKVFEAGSTLCLRSLALGRNEFTTGIVTALHMLRCFLPGLAEQRQFAEHLVAEQFRSFKGDKALKRSLDLKYRSLRQQLDAGLRAGAPEELAPLVSALVELAAQMAGEAAVVRRRMLADLIHMQLNRSFRQLQLRKELVVYHCLSKYLRSLSGKVKEQA